jgi:UDP-N-acetylglucosamine--N-acetylmuramyl-(pentapeptide) pyrophosphoryl-undecaprenol N-acetylglucosamine transferase
LLLVLGGSLGAESLNAAVLAGLRRDAERWRTWRIVHQTGSGGFEETRDGYRSVGLPARIEAFLPDVPTLLAEATLVVSRAGATTLAELACAGCAAVIVPWRRSADDHQRLNARWYADRDAVCLASEAPLGDEQSEATPLVSDVVTELAGSPSRRERLSQQMLSLARPDATAAVLQVIDATVAPPETAPRPAN